MPRSSRKQSASAFHHIVTKGDGGQIIFENHKHRTHYLQLLERSVNDFCVEVHAYCLMSNHVHLLIKAHPNSAGANDLSASMKQLNERYAEYFSKESGRVGHVFQGRFWSEPVETEKQFLSTLRYIHSNPEVAGICHTKDYPWSSYRAYTGSDSFVETGFALSLIGELTSFESFSESGINLAKPFKGSRLCHHLSYDELMKVSLNVLGRKTLTSLKAMRPSERAIHLGRLSNAGLAESDIARITGLGRGSIARLLPPK